MRYRLHLKKFERGCRVAYAREYLRNTSQFTGPSAPTSSGPFARGSVIEVEPFFNHKNLIRIHWDDGHISSVLELSPCYSYSLGGGVMIPDGKPGERRYSNGLAILKVCVSILYDALKPFTMLDAF